MFELLAVPLLMTLLVLLAAIALFKFRARFVDWPILYRVLLSTLIASFAPTLFLAGHGGIPLPTITGLVLTIMQMEWRDDLHLSIMGVGSTGMGLYLPPFLVCFALILLLACSKFRKRVPAMKPSQPW
ncbi:MULTISPECIES: hypothetical protein [Stenotrophomonas]|uniref:hypothetical protein n=1 Tax=Stenotrophomonas TaxID=40323 RepID=UPI00076FE998|nr:MULTISPECIES: hypothetical protein [Stenotrophomonas]AMJ56428.1 hypothetical protein AXG53_07035 [Stenotrophomonas sp. KCTC 12332]